MNYKLARDEATLRLIAAGCKVPHPGSKVVSERMLNMAGLFEYIGNYAAEGSFKALAKEVAHLEQRLNLLQGTVQYCVNRLDHHPDGPHEPQVSGDLAIALAASRQEYKA